MRKNLLFGFLLSIVVFYTFTNNADNISSPKGWNTCGSAGCHSNSTGTTTTVDSIILLHPTTGAIMTGYYPDSSYTLRMVASNSSGAATLTHFGFQLRTINSVTSAIIGTYLSPPAGTGVSSGMLTQSSKLINNAGKYIVLTSWKAPSTSVPNISLQAVVNAVNNNGNSSGDAYTSTIKTETLPVLGLITTLTCASGVQTGTLTSGTAASGVSYSVPYTGGNGGSHNGNIVTSTGVTGLTATLSAGSFTSSTGNLIYNISGTPSASGTANFAINIGTKTCTISIPVTAPVGSIATLGCGTGSTTGTLTHNSVASGVSFSIPYTGGNTGTHSGQIVTSTSVSGLTATLTSGNFANGAGTLVYNVTGTPTNAGSASFALNIGGLNCTFSVNVAAIVGTISSLNCAGAKTLGTLMNGTVASGVSFKVPYTGGNSGVHSGQSVNSTGVLGLTASLNSGTFVNGADSVNYLISGTPTSSGTASFALNIGGQTCTYTINVLPPVGAITALDCLNGTTTGSLANGVPASGVSFSVPYTGGNTGTHSGQIIISTGVTGLTATATSGTFNSGAGNINYTVTGTPASSGNAVFALSIGGQTCNYTITIGAGTVTALTCTSGSTTGVLVAGAVSSGVSFSIPYTGGNGGGHNGQSINSSSVTGLTAVLSSGVFNTGTGNVDYTVAGTPATTGNAVFNLNIGGKTCTYTINIIGGLISALNCGGATSTDTLIASNAATGVSITIPYTGGNGGSYSASSITSSGVSGLTANLGVGLFNIGTGDVTYFITGTPSSAGTADFFFTIGGKSCLYSMSVIPPLGTITALNCANGTTFGLLNAGAPASSVSFNIPYTGGNSGTYTSQTIASTGVTGLTASLVGGVFANGTGTLSYTISGTPSGSGNAIFALSLGGQNCTYSINVNLQLGTISSLDCATGTSIGNLNAASPASGVSFTIPYTGGNGGLYTTNSSSSTGVSGLTATKSADTFKTGAGSIIYTVTGTPSSFGTANFNLTIGGQTCSYSMVVNYPFGTIAALNCASGATSGTLIRGEVASGISITIPYTGGNNGTYQAQTVTSAGVLGLTASLTADTFKSGSGNLIYTITGTPTSIGQARFLLNIGGKTCTYITDVVLPVGTVSKIVCDSVKLKQSEPFMATIPFAGVSLTLPYTNGNGGTYLAQSITSTSVTGLTATLNNGILKTGDSFVTINISGSPASDGIADFTFTLGGRTCNYSIAIKPLLIGTITSLECQDGKMGGLLYQGKPASGSSFSLPYNGGNRGYHNGQVVQSSGVTGLTATLVKGQFAIGFGIVTYTITGTPASVGVASFNLDLGGQMCIYNIDVRNPNGVISTLKCGLGSTNTDIQIGRLNNGITMKIPYSGGNGGLYNGQTIQSTAVTGLTATLSAGNFNIGDGDLIYLLSGTTTQSGNANFLVDMGGSQCIYNVKVSSGTGSIHDVKEIIEVVKTDQIISIKNHTEKLEYSLVDITGKTIAKGELKKLDAQIDLSTKNISTSIIFLILTNSKGIYSYKLGN
jgi:hypothetical protein